MIKEENRDFYLLIFILLLIIPALFINLGLMPFILDEATRANVALEMLYSGDFIHPTINGELYFNKPPLYNWLLILSTKITGSFSEFSFRLPTVISLLLFAFTVYKTQKHIFGKSTALFSALALMTCGRILFYDSFLGLIDISFSWLIYLIFWSIYYYGEKRKYTLLFVSAYLFASLAFLMKAMPALVFLAISLLAYFISEKKFLKLLSVAHFLGFLVMVGIIGSYLLIFSKEVSLNEYFNTLWSESSKRTFLDNSLWQSTKHLILFPADFIYHFLPWTLFLVLLFRKSNRQFIFKNRATRIFGILFISNLVIYWVSPAIYPRYLFMFLPLGFGILFYIYFTRQVIIPERKIIKILFLMFTSALGLLILSSVFLADRDLIQAFMIKYILLLFLLILSVFLIRKKFSNYLLLSIAILFISRIAFGLFVFPDRVANETHQIQKNGALIAGKITSDMPLKIAKDTRIHHVSSFYIMRERGEILEYSEPSDHKDCLYIIEKEKAPEYPPHEIMYEFETRILGIRLAIIQLMND